MIYQRPVQFSCTFVYSEYCATFMTNSVKGMCYKGGVWTDK